MAMQTIKAVGAKRSKGIERRFRTRTFRDPDNWTTV